MRKLNRRVLSYPLTLPSVKEVSQQDLTSWHVQTGMRQI